MTVFAFTSVIDAIIPLESLGIVDKFMSEYLKFGEPYLLSSWGSAICCFDATVFYSLYLTIVYFHTNKYVDWNKFPNLPFSYISSIL